MSLTEAQLELRRTGIGSSDIAGVLGLHPWVRPIDVWQDKVGERATELEPSLADKGNYLEPSVAQWWASEHAVRAISKGETLVHPLYPNVLATPDFLVAFQDGRDGVLEVKCSDWGKGWGAPGTDQVPPHVVCQVHWQALVVEAVCKFKVSEVQVARLHGGKRSDYVVPIDPDLAGRQLGEALSWWRRYVVTKTPPPLDDSNSTREWLRRRFPAAEKQVFLKPNGEVEGWIFKLRDIRERERELKKAKLLAEAHIKEAIGSHAGLEGAWGRIEWKMRGKSRTFLPKFIGEEPVEGQEE